MDGHVEMHQVVVARPGDPYDSGGKLFDTSLMTIIIIIELVLHIHPPSTWLIRQIRSHFCIILLNFIHSC